MYGDCRFVGFVFFIVYDDYVCGGNVVMNVVYGVRW